MNVAQYLTLLDFSNPNTRIILIFNLDLFVVLLSKTKMIWLFTIFYYKCTGCRLFMKLVVRTQLDIYVFII
jgi:hypothetical protein